MSASPRDHRRVPGLSPLHPEDPEQVGPHRLIGRLGAGGMGVVYRARDRKSGGDVALKIMRGRVAEAPGALGQGFEREARALSELA